MSVLITPLPVEASRPRARPPRPSAPRSDGPTSGRDSSSLVGRPNVGKSTLVNQIVGRKVSIVSDRPQTTRTQVRGVRTTDDDADRVPRHARRAQAAHACSASAPTSRALVDARRGRRRLLPDRRERADRAAATASSPSASPQVRTPVVLVVNKIDRATPARRSLEHLAVASAELGDFAAFVPLSARTGEGVDALRRRARGAAARGSALLPRRRRERSARVVPRGRAAAREAARASPATSCRTRSR